MKINLIFLILLFATSFSYGQTQVQKINRDNFIGQKIKFLQNDINKRDYMDFSENPDAFPWLMYLAYYDRSATFVEKNGDLYTLKMDDNGQLVYFKHTNFTNITNSIGFFSLLDSARSKYLNKSYYNSNFDKCKIIAIEFAEDNNEYSQLFGPYNVFYTVDNDTAMINLHFTETYGPQKGYTYDFQKRKCFENIFKSENPFKPLSKSNIDEKFYIDIDDMDNKKTYIHKNLVDQDLKSRYNLTNYSLDFKQKAILTEIVLSNGIPKISFISNYYSTDWLYHSYIKIKIGDIRKQTTPVKGKREVLDADNIIETNYYSLPSDLAILKWIANNYTQEIIVRFYGTDYYDDFTIPMSEKLAIKETYELYILLKK